VVTIIGVKENVDLTRGWRTSAKIYFQIQNPKSEKFSFRLGASGNII